MEHSQLFTCHVNSGDGAVKKKKKEKGKGRKADLLTLTVMLVTVERKPTMVHGGYVCCSFSSSSPCRDTNLCFFFFCLPRLLLFGSFPFGLWWGWSCWWLSDGAVEVVGRWSCCEGRQWLFSSLCRGVSLYFLFCLLNDTPFSVAALWQRWRGRPTWFSFFLPSSFFLCNFLSPSLCFFHSFQKISHPLFSPSPFVLSFPFCPPPVFSSSPLSFLFSPPFSSSFSAFISQKMPCGATFSLVTTCRGTVAVKHSP